MYQHIIDALNETIKHHKGRESPVATENRDLHYFIQGLQIAKQVVAQCNFSAIDIYSHETFENTVKALWDNLGKQDMKAIIEEVSTEMEYAE